MKVHALLTGQGTCLDSRLTCQNSALAFKFTLLVLKQCACTQIAACAALPLVLRKVLLSDLCSARGFFFVYQHCQPIEGRLLLTMPASLRVHTLYFKEHRIWAGTLSTGFIQAPGC